MNFDELNKSGQSENVGSPRNKHLPASVFSEASGFTKSTMSNDVRLTSLLGVSLISLAPSDPVEREKELKADAKKYFSDKDTQDFYVKHRLSREFGGKFAALDAKDRLKLFGQWEARSWLGGLERLAKEDQAELNVSRWYPVFPEEIKKLAMRREAARLGREKDVLSVEEGATLDAWIRLPKTPKEREAFKEKLVAWRKAEQGDMPGNDEILKLAQAARSAKSLSGEDNNKLRVWRKYPYSKDYRSVEWALPAKVFADDDAAAKWFDEARSIELKVLNGKGLSEEESAKRSAYITSSTNPRMWQLTLRKRLCSTDAKNYPPLNKDEEAERQAWAILPNVLTAASEEGRKLFIEQKLDPSKFPAEKADKLRVLISLERNQP